MIEKEEKVEAKKDKSCFLRGSLIAMGRKKSQKVNYGKTEEKGLVDISHSGKNK